MTSSSAERLTPIQVAVALQSSPLFSDCTAEQVVRLAEIARQRRIAGGERIYGRGEVADALYVVVEGKVELRGSTISDEGANGSPRGEERREVSRGGTFGVVAILADRLRDEEAWTEMPSLLLALDADDFFDLLAHNIEIVKSLFRSLLRRGEVATRGAATAAPGETIPHHPAATPALPTRALAPREEAS